MEGPLYTANVRGVRRAIESLVDTRDPSVVVLVVSATFELSVTVADQVIELDGALAARGVRLWYAGLAPHALETAKQFPAWSTIVDEHRTFETADAAVRAYRRSSRR